MGEGAMEPFVRAPPSATTLRRKRAVKRSFIAESGRCPCYADPVTRQFVCPDCMETSHSKICAPCDLQNRARHDAGRIRPYDSAVYQRQRRAMLRVHIREKGAWCPGWGHRPAHFSGRLSLDHIVPVTAGGATVRGNLQVLCVQCNASKGDSV